MNEKKLVNKTYENLEKWFFGFWVRKYKVSFLLLFLIIFSGLFSLFTIPKESSPDIKFWIISISTIYPWVNPDDIDSLITEKIEDEISWIDWIKKYTSTSSVWISNTIIELYNDVDTRNALTDIKDAVDKVNLPEDAEDPLVIEISSSNELMFEVLLYWKAEDFSSFELMQAWQVIKNTLVWSSITKKTNTTYLEYIILIGKLLLLFLVLYVLYNYFLFKRLSLDNKIFSSIIKKSIIYFIFILIILFIVNFIFDRIKYTTYVESSWIESIELKWADIKWWITTEGWDYEIKVLLNKEKIELFWLSLRDISSRISSFNKNTPIWNYKIWDLKYDYRFDWELEDIEELKKVVLKWDSWSVITLWEIAKIVKEYKSDDIRKLWFYNDSWYNYISLVFNKWAWVNVFTVSSWAKKLLEDYISNNSELKWLNISYTKDMSELIIEDYTNLSTTAIQTIILVFLTILIFVWLRESIIASMLIPLSFLITFVVLDTVWLSLNFLTNFSLVLTLWIAIDTVIVIIEWASEKIRLGYNKRSAILLAVKDYKAPLIAWTLTTLVAFLPLMFLPWVMGRFLSYIPITVFSTLVAALVLSLTVSSALFVKFIKESKYFQKDVKLENSFSEKQKDFLEHERKNKTELLENNLWLRHRFLSFIWIRYYELLKSIVISRFKRLIIIILPIFALALTFFFLSPQIWFTLFPAADNAVITWTLELREWYDWDKLEKYIPVLDEAISKYPEIKVYYFSISWNTLDIYVELLNRNERESKGMKNVFEVEKMIYDEIKHLQSDWLALAFETLKEWPPTWKAVWIKLIASSSKQVEELKKVASIFKDELKTIPWAKNASTSASNTPGQFIFEFNREKLSEIWLTPDDLLSEIYFYTSWIKSGSIKSKYEDNDIVLKVDDFDDSLTPDDIMNLVLNTRKWKIRVGDFASYDFTKAVSSISRENWKISITVEADVEFWYLPSQIQPLIEKFAIEYDYPEWVSYVAWWENQENADLIASTMKSFFIALFLIFSILVFQFNSFSQPAIVLYSVVLALLWVNIWLYATWNPYSITFGIWFIALTWVVVNDAIILIDRINKNLEKGIDSLHAVIAAWKSRLQPIIVTTLTTVFWVLPLALQDEFWAWLGFTIVFWLFAGSSMTLFVIPALYYEVVLRKTWQNWVIK